MNRYEISKNIISTKINDEWYLMSFVNKKVIKLSEYEYTNLEKEKFNNFNNNEIEELKKLGIIVDSKSGKDKEYNSFIDELSNQMQHLW